MHYNTGKDANSIHNASCHLNGIWMAGSTDMNTVSEWKLEINCACYTTSFPY